MRWSCPHCGVNLAVQDDRLSQGWSFSRCYKCGGFALVREASVNVIKVDKAPAGENVLLPDSSEEPMFNREATQRLNQLRAPAASETPVVRPASRRIGEIATPPPITAAQQIQMNRAIQNLEASKQEAAAIQNFQVQTQARIAPSNAQNNSVISNQPKETPVTIPAATPATEVRGGESRAGRAMRAAMATASLVAVGSGIYLYNHGRRMIANAHAELEPTAVSAPAAQPAIVTTAAHASSATSEILDRLSHQAMAPARAPAAIAAAPSLQKMTVQLRGQEAKLHSGPGMEFPIIGTATQGRYTVLDWNDRWFRVAAQGLSTEESAKTNLWVRNDLVQVVKNN